MQKSNATLILILGIVGILCCNGLLNPFAWVMGNNTLKAMDAGQMDSSDRNLANIGRILGIIGTILLVFAIIMWIFFSAAMMAMIGMGGAASSAGM